MMMPTSAFSSSASFSASSARHHLVIASLLGDVAPDHHAERPSVDHRDAIREIEPQRFARTVRRGKLDDRRMPGHRVAGQALAHLLTQNIEDVLRISQTEFGERPADQLLSRFAEQASQRCIHIGHRAVRQGDEDDEIGRLVEQRVETLQTLDVLAQLRVITLVERALAQADDAGAPGLPIVHFRWLRHRSPERRPRWQTAGW
jgi:hypothetical protein